MKGILFDYDMTETTWVYLSSLLMIGIYFKFRRFWSVRNLDLVGLIAFAPGLLLLWYAHEAKGLQLSVLGFTREQAEQLGFTWLFAAGGLFLIRLLLDPLMVRRPMLEPNVTAGGLVFLGVALLVFISAKAVTQPPSASDVAGARQSESVLARQESADAWEFAEHGPGYPLFYLIARVPNEAIVSADKANAETEPYHRALVQRATTGTLAMLGHLAIVIGMVLIGYRHFDNLQTGVATAALYLLLPYTAQMTVHVDHVVPGALLVWAVLAYRRPMAAGMLLGLAAGVVYYPLFLLPLWASFYWRRGLVRFSIGVAIVLVVLVIVLLVTAGSAETFWEQLRRMFGALWPKGQDGFWQFHASAYRIPVLAAFLALCSGLALWPAQKNLGTLLSCSAAVMLGTQFWRAHQGGLFMAWYLPLLLLTIFRPNLDDRIALSAVREPWWPLRKARAAA
jgi:hypothetical protein